MTLSVQSFSSLKYFWTPASGLPAAHLLQVLEAPLQLVEHFKRSNTGCLEESGFEGKTRMFIHLTPRIGLIEALSMVPTVF